MFLFLNYNKIEEITGLEFYTNLICLDLSHNEIRLVSGLSSLTNLEILDISHNNIVTVDDVSNLKLNKRLLNLKVIFNPFSENKNFLP